MAAAAALAACRAAAPESKGDGDVYVVGDQASDASVVFTPESFGAMIGTVAV